MRVIISEQIIEKKFSYRKELLLKSGEKIDANILDKIINEMNGVLFKFEEFTNKQSINLFDY